MKTLDDLQNIKKVDKKNALESIKQLPLQCASAWKESHAIQFPSAYKDINNVVICGMGGSSFGARIVKSLYSHASMSKIPIELANDYRIPGYVNEKTLLILSSYSGNTQETLEAAKLGQKKGAKISGITCGGELAKILTSHSYPGYIFNPQFNPSTQPRIGVGYMVTGLLGILARLRIIPVEDIEMKKVITFLSRQSALLAQDIATPVNPAKQMAIKLQDKIPVFIVADFLDGAAYSIRNPFHETAKQFAVYFTVPELNHHLLEGLSYPKEIKKRLYFIIISSSFYDPRNIFRLQLTEEIIKKNEISCEILKLQGDTALMQTMELIAWGAWVTYYLALLRHLDPSEIPFVDYFKDQLKRRKIL